MVHISIVRDKLRLASGRSFRYAVEDRVAARNRRMMSDSLKEEIAKELSVYETVKSEGWGSVSSRDCGRIVQKAIEFAERSIGNQPK